MNNQLPERTPASNIRKLSQSLVQAFALNTENEQLLLTIYEVKSIEKFVEQWILENLLKPDDELTLFLLPLLVSRFHNHLEQMRSKQWLK